MTSSERPLSDLTARARVRDIALEMFAEHGVTGTSLRGVAEAAGVSTGLIQHHFGSKDGLRQACDTHAVGTLLEQAKSAAAGDIGQFAPWTGANELSTRYLARALVDRSSAAAELFDSGAELAESWLAANWPDRFPPGSSRLRDTAAVMGAMHLGTLALHEHLNRRIGVSVLASAHSDRLTAGIVDVYTAMADYLTTQQGAELLAAPADRAVAEDDRDG